jgi:hypothetical protein
MRTALSIYDLSPPANTFTSLWGCYFVVVSPARPPAHREDVLYTEDERCRQKERKKERKCVA